MIADDVCDLVDAFIGSGQQMLRFFEAYFLYISRIGKSGLIFDQAVKIILLKVKGVNQLLNCNICKIAPDVFRYFLKNEPVHGFSLLFGQGKIIFRAYDPEDAEQKPLTDVLGAYVMAA